MFGKKAPVKESSSEQDDGSAQTPQLQGSNGRIKEE